MIRYKDRVFEDYNIDSVTALITDKNGEVQKTYLNQGRPKFKNMSVHCIMAHTFYGWKPGFVVHHLDKNPLNNALSNLVYLTYSEHSKVHYSYNTRKKYRHHLPDIGLKKHWTNGIEERYCKDSPGDNWIQMTLKKFNRRK